MNPSRLKTRVKSPIQQAAMLAAVAAIALGSQAPVLTLQPTVVGCGSVITAPGHYALSADETCSGYGIMIAASGVHLDLAGFTLTGPGDPPGQGDSDGVRAEGVNDLHITGGALVAFDDGIDMVNVSNLRVTNVNVTGNSHAGMVLDNVDDSRITGCDASNNFAQGIGIGIGSDDNEVIGNTASFNGTDGVTFFGSSNNRNRIIGNTTTGNGKSGIDPSVGVDQLVQGNTVTGNHTGIFVPFDETTATIVGNVVTGNATGIHAGVSFGSRIQGNLVLGNSIVDMRDDNLPDCVNNWKGNTFVTDNEGDGPGAGCIR